MKLKKTKHRPSIFFAHSENEYSNGFEDEYPGLAAGFLSTKKLSSYQRNVWQKIFDNDWENICFSFASDLFLMGIRCFSIVPCSRVSVVEGIRNGFKKAELIEIENLIQKTDFDVSYANKDATYIKENTIIDYEKLRRKDIGRIAICDDYSESGKTLFGLHSTIIENYPTNKISVFLCSIGISKALANEG
jgi:hypothetical protein